MADRLHHLETKLLVACLPCNRQFGANADLKKLVASNPDWDRLLTLAGFHGLLPILTYALERDSWAGVPYATKAKLVQRNGWHIRKAVSQSRALLELNARFQGRRLAVINWKGYSLGADLYAKPSLREYSDLDFLVAKHELEDTSEILTACGFIPHLKAADTRRRRLIARYDAELCYFRERDQIYVELHTGFLPPKFGQWQDLEAAFMHATLRKVPGAQMLTLHPQDLLISLCAHGIKHHWGRLKWLADIARFADVYRHDFDWKLLLQHTDRSAQTLAVLHSLLLAETIFGVRMPQEIKEIRVSPALALLTERSADVLLSGGASSLSETDIIAQVELLFPVKMDRWLFALRRMSEPQDKDIKSRHRFPRLTKVQRLYQQVGWVGILEKVKLSFSIGA